MNKVLAEKIINRLLKHGFSYDDGYGQEDLTQDEKEALQLALSLFEQNMQLANRCYALTHGTLCFFCPIECDHRANEFRGDIDNDVVSEDNEG